MHDHLAVFTAIGIGFGLMLASIQVSVAQQYPVTAIDIALEPDAHPHIFMLQQFVRTRESWSNRRKTCIGYKMKSSQPSSLTL
jgi:hypothetical protein